MPFDRLRPPFAFAGLPPLSLSSLRRATLSLSLSRLRRATLSLSLSLRRATPRSPASGRPFKTTLPCAYGPHGACSPAHTALRTPPFSTVPRRPPQAPLARHSPGTRHTPPGPSPPPLHPSPGRSRGTTGSSGAPRRSTPPSRRRPPRPRPTPTPGPARAPARPTRPRPWPAPRPRARVLREPHGCEHARFKAIRSASGRRRPSRCGPALRARSHRCGDARTRRCRSAERRTRRGPALRRVSAHARMLCVR